MNKARIEIPADSDEITLKLGAVYKPLKDDIDATKQLMHYVVIVLLVMVAAIVIDVLLARIWDKPAPEQVYIIPR